MKNGTFIVLTGIALCVIAFYAANTGRFFGAFINRLVPCTNAPGNSFPCYGVYDIALMAAAAISGLILLVLLSRSLYKCGDLRSAGKDLLTGAIAAVAIVACAAVLALGIYAAWYSYDRHAKIARNEQCSHTLSQPIGANPSGAVSVLPSCVYEIVPPTLWEKLTGQTGGLRLPRPISGGCDRSATTTDCTSLPAQTPPLQELAPGVVNTTESIGSFTFGYPEGQGELSTFGWEGVVFPGDYTLILRGITNYELFIFTTPAPLSSINPAAISLDDYRHDYSSADGKGVHILSSEDVTINGIPMLRQRYSVGYWATDQNGKRTFKSDSEADMTNELRYVFFDDIDTKFAILTGWQADDSIDYVAHTIQLLRS